MPANVLIFDLLKTNIIWNCFQLETWKNVGKSKKLQSIAGPKAAQIRTKFHEKKRSFYLIKYLIRETSKVFLFNNATKAKTHMKKRGKYQRQQILEPSVSRYKAEGK